ncbi:unnamed protein product [Rotaria sp. Silwood2]|nr:unnamed protein product [Rotaria sp. Silwood2]
MAEYQCIIKVFVFLQDNSTTETEINYGYDPTNGKDPSTNVPDHYVRLGVSRQLLKPVWSHSIQYNCITDGCNSAENLKRVIKAIIQIEQAFEQLDSLIDPLSSFDPSSCLNYSNATTPKKCDSPVEVSQCRQCSLEFDTNNHQTCAGCVKFDEYYANSVTRWALFRMKDRSESNQYQMQCSIKGCNSPENTDRIRRASTIQFDFDRFLGSAGIISTPCNVFSLIAILLIGGLFSNK